MKGPARKLHSGHFAFMRGVVQGLDIVQAWMRYLETEGEHTDLRVVKSTEAWIRREFAAAAKREQKPGTARLVMLEPNLWVEVERPLPSLEEFAQEQGMEDFSQAEQLEAYNEAYGTGKSQVQRRRAKLIDRQLIALEWLRDLVTQEPQAGDGVGVWFVPSMAKRLEAAGLMTLQALADRINAVGQRWWSMVPGVGEKKGARIIRWMQLHESSTELSIGFHALELRSQFSRADLDRVVPHGTALVPFDKFIVPSDLDGSEGVFRAPRSLLGARNDYQAIEAWLRSKQAEVNTQRSYRREAERLLLWAVLERHKPISSLTTEDAFDYLDFLTVPPERWCGPRHVQRWSPAWRPLEGGLSDSARRQTLRILRALFAFLIEQAYLTGNPFTGVPDPKVPKRPLGAGKAFTQAQWAHIEQVAGEDTSELGRRRSRALQWLYLTGLRTSEMCAVKLGDLEQVHYIDDHGGSAVGWVLAVIGKGKRQREVVVPGALMNELHLEMESAGVDLAGDVRSLPILGDFSRVKQGATGWLAPAWSASGLYKAVKRVLDAAALQLDVVNAARLRKASTHWIRHTHGTHGVTSGLVPVEMMRDNLGHSSIDTTSDYVSTERDARLRAMAKFAERKL